MGGHNIRGQRQEFTRFGLICHFVSYLVLRSEFYINTDLLKRNSNVTKKQDFACEKRENFGARGMGGKVSTKIER
jgi:hypothetical protein